MLSSPYVFQEELLIPGNDCFIIIIRFVTNFVNGIVKISLENIILSGIKVFNEIHWYNMIALSSA